MSRDHASSAVNIRSAAALDCFERLIKLRFDLPRRIERTAVSGILATGFLDAFRYIYQHWTAPPGHRQRESLRNDRFKLINLANDEVMLNDQLCDTDNIDLLKAVLPKERHGYISGNRD
ncbi:hypothetical protein SDC9_160834 [bioreactor metagenome]|uniref:Uncharacterized protein n=1 Tax=bioreactor metagenome TaxID=1076179 RepID=A0A645FMT7_9ZZZZ